MGRPVYKNTLHIINPATKQFQDQVSRDDDALENIRFLNCYCCSIAIDDTAKGGLTQFWEIFTVITCAPKDFRCKYHCSLKTLGPEIKNEGSSELEKAILRFLVLKKRQQSQRPQRITVKVPK